MYVSAIVCVCQDTDFKVIFFTFQCQSVDNNSVNDCVDPSDYDFIICLRCSLECLCDVCCIDISISALATLLASAGASAFVVVVVVVVADLECELNI